MNFQYRLLLSSFILAIWQKDYLFMLIPFLERVVAIDLPSKRLLRIFPMPVIYRLIEVRVAGTKC